MSVTRRGFVRAGGIALFSLGIDPLFLDRAAYAATNRLSASNRLTVPFSSVSSSVAPWMA